MAHLSPRERGDVAHLSPRERGDVAHLSPRERSTVQAQAVPGLDGRVREAAPWDRPVAAPPDAPRSPVPRSPPRHEGHGPSPSPFPTSSVPSSPTRKQAAPEPIRARPVWPLRRYGLLTALRLRIRPWRSAGLHVPERVVVVLERRPDEAAAPGEPAGEGHQRLAAIVPPAQVPEPPGPVPLVVAGSPPAVLPAAERPARQCLHRQVDALRVLEGAQGELDRNVLERMTDAELALQPGEIADQERERCRRKPCSTS